MLKYKRGENSESFFDFSFFRSIQSILLRLMVVYQLPSEPFPAESSIHTVKARRVPSDDIIGIS